MADSVRSAGSVYLDDAEDCVFQLAEIESHRMASFNVSEIQFVGDRGQTGGSAKRNDQAREASALERDGAFSRTVWMAGARGKVDARSCDRACDTDG